MEVGVQIAFTLLYSILTSIEVVVKWLKEDQKKLKLHCRPAGLTQVLTIVVFPQTMWKEDFVLLTFCLYLLTKYSQIYTLSVCTFK